MVLSGALEYGKECMLAILANRRDDSDYCDVCNLLSRPAVNSLFYVLREGNPPLRVFLLSFYAVTECVEDGIWCIRIRADGCVAQGLAAVAQRRLSDRRLLHQVAR